MRWQKIVLVLMLCLYPVSLHAQCGWVLWETILDYRSEKSALDGTKVIAGFPSYELCMQEMRDRIDQAVSLWKGHATAGKTEWTHYSKNGMPMLDHSFQCLPSTIDPRDSRK